MKQSRPKRGRPKAEPGTSFSNRHVVNLNDEQQKALTNFCEANGIARLTDGIRQLLVKSLKAEGVL